MAASPPPPPNMRIHVNTNLYGPQHIFAYTETTMGFVFRSWLLIHTLAHVSRQTTRHPKHTADEAPSASLAVFVLDMYSVWDITFISGRIFFNGEAVQITHRSYHKGNKTNHKDLFLFKFITTNERRSSVVPSPNSGVNSNSQEKRSPGLILPL